MKQVTGIIFFICFFCAYLSEAQTVKISYPGSLPGDWDYWENKDNPNAFSVINVSRENLGSRPSKEDKMALQDYQSQVFINFLQNGGANLSAYGSSLSDYIQAYVSENEYSEYLQYYNKNFKSRTDYIKEKYGDKVPSGINKVKLGKYEAYSFIKRGTNEGKEEGSEDYFILLNEASKAGVATSLKISAIPEKRNYSYDDYLSSAVSIINKLEFKEEENPANKNEIIVTGTFKAYQQISPPARGVEALSNLSLKKWFQRGSAHSYLCLTVQVSNPHVLPFVTVDFEIDEPCSLTGPSKRIRADDDKKAIATFIYNTSQATGQGGVIFARAIFPEKIFMKEDGSFEASEKKKKLTIPIRPVCSEFDFMSNYYKDNLMSDVTYTSEKIERDFIGVIKQYQTDNSTDVTASNFWRSGLLWFLGNHAGEALGLKLQYYSGNEIQLSQYIINASEKQTPASIFKKALEINKGDVTKALLACHNVIRSAARGAEDFSGQLSPEEKKLLEKSDYKGLDKATVKQKFELEQLAGRYKNSSIYDNLVPLRQEDNMGAWYHFFATTLVSFNNHSAMGSEGIINYGDALDVMIWMEENIISGDIYSDPNEYCVDHMGLNLGDALAKNFFPNILNINHTDAFDKYLKKRKNADEKGTMPLGVSVHSPVSIKITDKATGEYFSYNQQNGDYEGNLAAVPLFTPEGKGNNFKYSILLPAGEYKVNCDAIDNGIFSFYTFNFNDNKGARYENINVNKGNQFHMELSPENTTSPLQDENGKSISPEIVQYDENKILEIRENALTGVIENYKSKQEKIETTVEEENVNTTNISKFNIFTIIGIVIILLGTVLVSFKKSLFGGMTLLIGLILLVFGLIFYKPAVQNQLQNVNNTPTELENQIPQEVEKEDVENQNKIIEQDTSAKEIINETENNTKPDDELTKAKQEYEDAYSKYTKLSTEGGEGDILKALEEYKEKYEKYIELKKQK